MFQKKVVVITGAGSGIGRALAIEFAGEGALLALADINAQALAESLSLLPQGSQARSYLLDVTSRDAVFQFAEDVVREFGYAHFVINNAGTSVLATVEHTTMEVFENVLAINLWGVIYGTKAFLPILLKQREGCIVNVSSVFGLLATPCAAAYTISKFAVRALTETLWQELPGSGVRAVLVHPGGINTNISNDQNNVFQGPMELKVKEANLRQMTTTPQACAKQVVEGLRRGKPRLLVGNGANILHWISRLLPDSYGTLVRHKLGL
ncbi:SDR family oxidoreductase [Pseudomonas sp.]|uniref:SDR family NAD(P)-dependent oxidoreductase n=1 Tax=Pseudomonas sp. TaxID=306 RepID=UPI00260EDB88|nr:SDR family oxidoreductase [Pseudomonas sp.]